jgi:phosphate/sulfate permease
MTFLTIISGLALAFSDYMVIGLAVDNPEGLIWLTILGAYLVGLFGVRFIMTLEASNLSAKPMSGG